ncbi:MAG: hypothetical protein LBC21_04355 [Oscillospiraceae bacterium]|jgi:rod shape-determining protein MreD|nr:hypothetical protein [Oscillospiraceae bacterium]
MKKRFILIGLLLHAIVLVALYSVQTFVFPYLSVTGVRPALLPLGVAGVAVFEGSSRGGLFGLFAGILCDISFNQPISSLTLLLTLFGITAGFLSDIVIARGFPSYIVCCAIVLALTEFTQMFALLFFEKLPIPLLMKTAAQRMLYSMVFSLPVYFAVKSLGRRDLSENRRTF